MILFIIGIVCLVIAIILLIAALSIKVHKDNQQRAYENTIDVYEDRVNELYTLIKGLEDNYHHSVDVYRERLNNTSKEFSQLYHDEVKKNDALMEEEKNRAESQIAIYQLEIDKAKATLNAVREAEIRKRKIEEDSSFYCLKIGRDDKSDIELLEDLKTKFSKPRVISMLIWSNYYRDKFTQLCNDVIGTQDKSGIYKITNLKTNQCYIGQAKNLSKR